MSLPTTNRQRSMPSTSEIHRPGKYVLLDNVWAQFCLLTGSGVMKIFRAGQATHVKPAFEGLPLRQKVMNPRDVHLPRIVQSLLLTWSQLQSFLHSNSESQWIPSESKQPPHCIATPGPTDMKLSSIQQFFDNGQSYSSTAAKSLVVHSLHLTLEELSFGSMIAQPSYSNLSFKQ